MRMKNHKPVKRDDQWMSVTTDIGEAAALMGELAKLRATVRAAGGEPPVTPILDLIEAGALAFVDRPDDRELSRRAPRS